MNVPVQRESLRQQGRTLGGGHESGHRQQVQKAAQISPESMLGCVASADLRAPGRGRQESQSLHGTLQGPRAFWAQLKALLALGLNVFCQFQGPTDGTSTGTPRGSCPGQSGPAWATPYCARLPQATGRGFRGTGRWCGQQECELPPSATLCLGPAPAWGSRQAPRDICMLPR